MNKEQFEKAIQFTKKVGIGPSTYSVEATVTFRSNLIIDKNVYIPDDEIHKQLIERLYRYVYDFDKQQLFLAILDFRQCAPFNYLAQEQCIEAIFQAAQRQPPIGV